MKLIEALKEIKKKLKETINTKITNEIMFYDSSKYQLIFDKFVEVPKEMKDGIIYTLRRFTNETDKKPLDIFIDDLFNRFKSYTKKVRKSKNKWKDIYYYGCLYACKYVIMNLRQILKEV